VKARVRATEVWAGPESDEDATATFVQHVNSDKARHPEAQNHKHLLAARVERIRGA